jgi:ABC-type amino acid transport substrate-binding protein
LDFLRGGDKKQIKLSFYEKLQTCWAMTQICRLLRCVLRPSMIISPLSPFKVIFYLSLLFSTASFSQEVKMLSFKIPEYVTSSTEGTFIRLTKDISQKIRRSINIELYPPKRTVLNFNLQKADGYFPALDVLNKGKVLKSEPFYYKRDYLFSLKKIEQGILKKSKEAKKLKICITRGYPYNLEKVEVPYELLETTSDERCFEVLKKKRADYFLGELHTGIKAANNSSLEKYHIYPEAISSLPVYYAFQDNERGLELRNKFSKEIQKMKADGQLSKYFKSSMDRINKVVPFGYDPTKKN